MTIKHALIFALFTLCTFQLNAQFSYGVKAEYGVTMKSNEETLVVSTNQQLDNKMEINELGNSKSIGLFTQFQFGFLYLQPELLYTNYSNSYMLTTYAQESPNVTTGVREEFHYIDMPVNAGIKINNFRLGGGPIFQYLVALESDFEQVSNATINSNSISAGFQGGIGYDWKHVHFDIKYQDGFSSVSEHLKFDGSMFKMNSTMNSIKLGVAVTF